MDHQIQGQQRRLKLYDLQVSGKAPKFVTSDEKLLLKGFNDVEYKFFEHFKSLQYSNIEHSIIRFIPAYRGLLEANEQTEVEICQTDNKRKTEWLEHLKNRHSFRNQDSRYILLQNFTHGFQKPNVLDMKIGGRGQKVHKMTKSVKKFGIKLNGMYKSSSQFQEDFRSKYELNKISDPLQFRKNIAWFFYNRQSNCLNLKLIEMAISKLKQIILAFRCLSDWKFISSSICMAYDFERQETFIIKFIDFGRAAFEYTSESFQKYDEQTCKGMQYIVQFLLQIQEDPHYYDNMQLEGFHGDVIPDSKIIKYGLQKTPPRKDFQT